MIDHRREVAPAARLTGGWTGPGPPPNEDRHSWMSRNGARLDLLDHVLEENHRHHGDQPVPQPCEEFRSTQIRRPASDGGTSPRNGRRTPSRSRRPDARWQRSTCSASLWNVMSRHSALPRVTPFPRATTSSSSSNTLAFGGPTCHWIFGSSPRPAMSACAIKRPCRRQSIWKNS
jgi:hypothetical protein